MTDPDHVLFTDIETAPEYPSFEALPEIGKYAFTKKFGRQVETGTYRDLEDAYVQQAPLLAEFSRVICISGAITKYHGPIMDASNPSEGIPGMRKPHATFNITDPDEARMLESFKGALDKFCPEDPALVYHQLCAHNGKSFDFPFLSRRCLINGLRIPKPLDTEGKKPWEVFLLDTADYWKFTDFRYMVSLVSMCHAFRLPMPKEAMAGEDVMAAWFAGEIDRIKQYCFGDVVAVGNIYCKMAGKEIWHDGYNYSR